VCVHVSNFICSGLLFVLPVGDDFDMDICAQMTRKTALIEAVAVKDLIFNGTSNFQKCRNLLTEVCALLPSHIWNDVRVW